MAPPFSFPALRSGRGPRCATLHQLTSGVISRFRSHIPGTMPDLLVNLLSLPALDPVLQDMENARYHRQAGAAI